MPFTFTVNQIYGLPGNLVFTDTSTDVDPNINERHIFLRKEDGTYLNFKGATTDYIIWDNSLQAITLVGILDKDYALYITVEWDNVMVVNPNPFIFDNSFDSSFS